MTNRKLWGTLALLIDFIAALIATTYIRFSHPGLTETQLFLNYWYVWVSIVIVFVIAALVRNSEDS